MLRSILLLVVVLMAFDALRPWLARLGLRRLPGDLTFRLLGRERTLPLGTAVLLSVIGWTIARLI